MVDTTKGGIQMTNRMPVNMKLSLKTARELKALTQEEAAKMLQVSAETLSNYERGKTYPDIPVLRKIEQIYDVTYNQLIFLPLDYGLTE